MTATNICKFQGRIVRKSEIKPFEGKTNSAINLTLAVDSQAINAEGQLYDRTDFAQLVFWDDLATEVAALPKNSVITVEARMQTRNYKLVDGTKRYVTEFVALAIVPAIKSRKRA